MLIENRFISLTEASKVQTLIFDKDRKWNIEKAKEWAKKHNFKFGKVDEKENTIRLRQEDPKKFDNMRTIIFGKGIKAVVGF